MRTRRSARHRIGLRRDLANPAFDLNGGEQLQADREWQADFQRKREIFARYRTTASRMSGLATVTTF